MRLQANRREDHVIEIRWVANSRQDALDSIEFFYDLIPEGYTEELVAHRRRVRHGQRRSCTMNIRWTNREYRREWSPEEVLERFREAAEARLQVIVKGKVT